MSKDLILLRGLPGSGKSTIAKLIANLANHREEVYEICTDYYWDLYNDSEFDPELLDKAHSWTEEKVESVMKNEVPLVILHNTLTQPWEWESYNELADRFGYRVHHLITEKRHDGESSSGVPQKTIDKMEARFQIRLQ